MSKPLSKELVTQLEVFFDTGKVYERRGVYLLSTDGQVRIHIDQESDSAGLLARMVRGVSPRDPNLPTVMPSEGIRFIDAVSEEVSSSSQWVCRRTSYPIIPAESGSAWRHVGLASHIVRELRDRSAEAMSVNPTLAERLEQSTQSLEELRDQLYDSAKFDCTER